MNLPKENKMAIMPMGNLIASMSLPLMISLLVQSLYNIVDGMFVAMIDENALTATSLVFPIQLLMIAVSVGNGVGVNAVISQKLGAKKKAEANHMATVGMILSLLCGAVFMLLGIFCTEILVRLFTNDKNIMELCIGYLQICMVFCLGIFVETLAQRLLQATGNTFLSMISLVAGALTNIILDPIMIFGLFGFPALGIRGAAIATVIGQWLGAGIALLLNWRKNPEIHFEISNFKLDITSILAIYRVGAPTIVMQAIGSIMVSAVNVILLPFSTTAVAFFGIYYKLQNFLFMPMNGLGQALIPIIGYNYGATNSKRIMQAMKTAIPAAIGMAALGTLVFMFFPDWLLGLFSASETMLEMGVPALRIISVTFMLSAVTIIVGYIASGLGNGIINMMGTVIRQLIVFLPLAFLFARSGGVDKIWYAIWISESAALIYSIVSICMEVRKK